MNVHKMLKNESGLICHEHFPLCFSVTQEEDVAAQYAQCIQLNEERLHTLLRLDDCRSDVLEDVSAGLSPELQKLDFKLNFVLDMLGQLMAVGTKTPDTVSIVLSPHRLAWRANQTCHLGDWVKVELYLHAGYPLPVILFGQIDECHEDETGFQLGVFLSQMPEQQQELYEKFLFRCHRRTIARSKKYG